MLMLALLSSFLCHARASTSFLSAVSKDIDGRDKPGRDESIMHSDLALALPDQDQADGGQRGAVSGPPDLADHEARLGPLDHAGALTDPEQPDGEREKANHQKQVAHGICLVRSRPCGPARCGQSGARFGARQGAGAALANRRTTSFCDSRDHKKRYKKAPDDAGAFERMRLDRKISTSR